jgi:hypothetical protein
MKKTSLMRRLVGLGFALLILTANLTIVDASMQEAARSGSQDGATKIKACGVEGDRPIYKHSYALVIGESNYLVWPKLPGTKADVDAVEKVLKEHGFTVSKLMDPTWAEFTKAINDFKEKHDRLTTRFVLYFSGHGFTEITPIGLRIGYIVPSDAPSPNMGMGPFSAKAISSNLIETIARDISPCHALFVFDSCFSGSIFTAMRSLPEGITVRTKLPVRLFITASSANQKVPDDSIFRQAFVRGLEGAADLNKDNYVTGIELANFLVDKVSGYSRESQTPLYGKMRDPHFDQGDIVFEVPSEPKRDFQPVLEPKLNSQPVAQTKREPQQVVKSDGGFQPFALDSKYFPSGWMGFVTGVKGTGTLTVERQVVKLEGKDTIQTRIEYKQGPEKGWAGIYWQHPDNNWGDEPGFDLTGAKRISFYARGERGGEIVEFISGGINSGKKYKDMYKESTGLVPLTKEFTKYAIDLSRFKNKELSNVIGAFAWVASGGFDEDRRVVVYIADLKVE